MSVQDKANTVLQDIMDRIQDVKFDMDDIDAQVDEKGPYTNVFMQECEWMNTLIFEMVRSLNELTLGFTGRLTMSDAMDALANSMYLNRVSPTWGNLAWPSQRTLQSWLLNMKLRIDQLSDWCGNPLEIPRVTWLSGLINPQSFLTAIKQVTAQAQTLELDTLIVETEVSNQHFSAFDRPASKTGAFVHGFSLQGASWDLPGIQLVPSIPKEMYVAMPVILCKSLPSDKGATSGVFHCPVYKTEVRGNTYVFKAQLKTKAPPARWVLAGVAVILDIV